MLFGIFFGAGNLIFPVLLGQQAGSQTLEATLGFILSAVGFSLMGLLGLSLTKSNNVLDIASPGGKLFAYFFNIVMLLVIGPALILPRLATTSFELGISAFIQPKHYFIARLIFSVGFFLIVFLLALKPTKLVDYIGKYLTPTFLVLLLILIIFALIKTPVHIGNLPATAAYQHNAFLSGFLEGYNTVDAGVSILFGSLAISALKDLGVVKPKQIAIDTAKAGFFAMALMAALYGLLTLVGAMSVNYTSRAANGGIILVAVAKHLFGTLGLILLMLIVILACLKTAIGISSAVADGFNEMLPKVSYPIFLALACVISMLLALFGLTKITIITSPLLMFIYPFALVIIMLAFLNPLVQHNPLIYKVTLGFTFLPAVACGLRELPAQMQQIGWIKQYLNLINHLPLANVGMAWVIPALIGFVLSLIISKIISKLLKVS